MARPTERESSYARNDFHLAYSTVSKILARSRGPDSSVKSSKPISSGEAADRNGACADAATCEISSSGYMRTEEPTSELPGTNATHVCRLLLEKQKYKH